MNASKGSSFFTLLFAGVVMAMPFTACDDQGDPDGVFDPGDNGPGAASARFFLPTGEPDNTVAPTMELDRAGNLHMIYAAYAGGDAYYGYCPDGCDEPDEVQVVRFQTDGTVHAAMIALDDAGRPRVLLAAAQKVYYATCDGDCGKQASWKQTQILDHHGENEVDGEAFALDRNGRPRFLMHVYKAYLGIGQKPPAAFYVTCDADCHTPSSWKTSKIADQMWRYSTLRFDAGGTAKVATTITMADGTDKAAYVECDHDCAGPDNWNGIGLMEVFESDVEAVRVTPSVSMALTRDGAPRIVLLGLSGGKRNLTYFACDRGCSGDNWKGSIISDHDKLDVGLDLALDKNDHPRFVHTLDYNIALAYCDEDDCTAQNAKWNLTKVEYGGEMKKDEIYLWPNCTVGAWFLHSPSLALTADGKPRVGYQARDVSGGWHNPNPHTEPDCVAGTDMTLSRVALMKGVQ